MHGVGSTRRREAAITDTGETVPMNAPDQVVVQGLVAGAAPCSIHYRGGIERDGRRFLWG